MRFDFQISRIQRNKQNGHASHVLLFTGLSGSGKSTLANFLERELFHQGIQTYVLDGDAIRGGINKELSFSAEDRMENMRRVSELAKLFMDAGMVVLVCLISPYAEGRRQMQSIVGTDHFSEIYVNSPVDVCEERDTKGLYRRARSGEILQFTGISAPYEAPKNPAIEIRTDILSIDESVQQLVEYTLPKLNIV